MVRGQHTCHALQSLAVQRLSLGATALIIDAAGQVVDATERVMVVGAQHTCAHHK